MSLTAAAKDSWLDPATRAEARKMLKAWQPPPPNSPEIIDWRQQVLGYFRSMYRNPNAAKGEEWNASTMIVDRDRDPLENADDHAGVHLIRRYYPDYVPTEEDFGGAYWGSKPEGATAHEARRSMRAPDRDRPIGMTYGTVPPFKKFERDIRRPNPDQTDGGAYWPSGTLYPMELVDEHEIELAEDYGLDEFEADRRRTGQNSRVRGFKGSEHDIHGFVRYLSEKFDEGDEEAGNLASSIMTTLGYEWI